MKWVTANRLYDYFFKSDKCVTKKTKYLCYEDCEGSQKSISWEEDEPYEFTEPILAPCIFDYTMNTNEFYEGKVINFHKLNMRELEVTLDCSMNSKSLVSIGYNRDLWKIKYIRRDKKGFVHLLKKLDNSFINSIDLSILNRVKKIRKNK